MSSGRMRSWNNELTAYCIAEERTRFPRCYTRYIAGERRKGKTIGCSIVKNDNNVTRMKKVEKEEREKGRKK